MSNIPANLKTPGTYFDVNTNTQRTGLPTNTHKVLFVTLDVLSGQFNPIDVYDKNTADKLFGDKSQAGRMIVAAVKTNRVVDAQAVALVLEDVRTQDAIHTEDGEPVLTEAGGLLEPN